MFNSKSVVVAIVVVVSTMGFANADADHGYDTEKRDTPMMVSPNGSQGMMQMMIGMHRAMMNDMMSAGMNVALQTRIKEFDTNGDSALTIEEFETLHVSIIRERMVDRFQH